MDEPAAPNLLPVTCPRCGGHYRVAPQQLGRSARCTQCAETFVLAAPQAAPGDSQAQGLCPLCQSPIAAGESQAQCSDCRIAYHADCWEYNRGCATYGCPQAPPTEPLSTLEVPVSYWGKEEKPCPMCGQTILAAAVVCRFCGTTFASARPETAGDLHRRASLQVRLPRIRTHAIWLLIFSLVPCTAPLVTVVGAIWYHHHRSEIRELPGTSAAICKMAVGVAVGQTAAMACWLCSMRLLA